METADPRHIIGGNERVVRPRLSDAKFFFEQDKKKKLADARAWPGQRGLSQQAGHARASAPSRVTALAVEIAGMLGADAALAARAALLAKTDLLTDMVGEFPELQGIMGTYYARHDGEPEEVAQCDFRALPAALCRRRPARPPTGTVVALADKLETLVGIWGIGLQPTGDKDPFALRRHALGILRMLVEKRLPLAMLGAAAGNRRAVCRQRQLQGPGAPMSPPSCTTACAACCASAASRQNEIEAVVAQQPDALDNIVERLEAVQAFAALPEAESLAAANKRITNILKKADAAGAAVQSGLLQESAEQGLYAAMTSLKPHVDAGLCAGRLRRHAEGAGASARPMSTPSSTT